MRKGKLRLETLRVVALVALGVLAIGATEASAADFQIGGKTALLAKATGKPEGKAFLLVPNRNLKILCSIGEFLEGTEIVDAKKALAKILFLECITLNHKSETEVSCNVSPEGAIEATVSVLPIEHGGNTYVLVEGDESESLATVKLEGGLCPLPVSNPIKGSAVAQVTANNQVEDLITFDQTIQELLGELVAMGGFDAFLDGDMAISLTESHAGLKFGVRTTAEEEAALTEEEELQKLEKEELEELEELKELEELTEEEKAELEELQKLENEELEELKELEFMKSLEGADPVSFIVNKSTKSLLTTLTGAQESEASFLVPGRNTQFKCAASHILEGSEILSEKEALVRVQVLGCEVRSHKTGTSIPCTIDNFTATAIALPVRHGGNKYVLFESDGGAPLAIIVALGASCPLPKTYSIFGTTAAQVTKNYGVENLVTFSQATQELLGDLVNYFGAFDAFITASVSVSLTGKHLGLKFGVL